MPLVPNKLRVTQEPMLEASHLRLQKFVRELTEAATPKSRLAVEKDDKAKERLAAMLRVLEIFIQEVTDEQAGNVILSSHASTLLARLINAIDELRYGIVDPLLERRRSFGKPKLYKNEVERRKDAIALYKIMGRKGIPEDQRYRDLAKKFGATQKVVQSWIKNSSKSKTSKKSSQNK